MRVSNFVTPLFEAVCAAMILLFFVCFGDASSAGAYAPMQIVTQKLGETFHQIMNLVAATALHQNVRENYFGLIPVHFWYTLRLVILSVVVACVVGIGFPILKTRVTNRIIHALFEGVSILAESIPEPMYVTMTVVLTLFLIEHFAIYIPAFPVLDPKPIDTVIPGIALGLAGGFGLARVLFIRLRDESDVEYIQTAVAKGASSQRVFYHHVLQNILPAFIKQLPTMGAMILSSAIFAENLFEYQGALFGLTMYGFGSVPKPNGIPTYEPGYLFCTGLMLIAAWLLIRLISELWYQIKYPADLQSAASPKHKRIQYAPIVVGSLLLAAIVTVGLFPSLVTHHSASQQFNEGRFGALPPYGPNAKFPMGTDTQGRDLLARAVHGTWATLFPVATTTLVIVVGSLVLSACAVANPNGWLSRAVRRLGTILASLPVLFLLLLAMHERAPENARPLTFIIWISVFEVGRGAFTLMETYEDWYRFGFVESAHAIGRSRTGILATHLRGWLRSFILEFAFSQFARVMSLLMMLAVFQIYPTETYVSPMFPETNSTFIIGSAANTWFSMLGDMIQNFAYVSYGYFLDAPTLMLLLTMIGANLIARGIRGTTVSTRLARILAPMQVHKAAQ